jgi:hypothetical protein
VFHRSKRSRREKFFKKIDATAQLARLTEAMRQIFSSDPKDRGVVCNAVTKSPNQPSQTRHGLF